MSGDPEQEYFADGMAEDITIALSKLGWFFVIARNSRFVYKGKSPDVRQVARELGARYVLEGSVRKAGNRLRITAQLVDATTGNHVWAEQYDREIAEIFSVQDEIAERTVASIEPQLYAAENLRIQSKPPESLDVWDCVKGIWFFWRQRKDTNAEAQGLFRQALNFAPSYARAHSLLAISIMWSVWEDWSSLRREAIEIANDAARFALSCDGQDAWGHLTLGLIVTYRRDTDGDGNAYRTALTHNPNFAMAHGRLGVALAYGSRTGKAMRELYIAFRISPRDPNNSLFADVYAIAYVAAERYSKAEPSARKAIRLRPDFVGAYRALSVSCAHSAKLDEARSVLAKLRTMQPDISLAWAEAFSPYGRPEHRARYVEGFRLAGLK
jgi:TolB-like protein